MAALGVNGTWTWLKWSKAASLAALGIALSACGHHKTPPDADEPVTCEEDADCGNSRRCDPTHRCVECLAEKDCAAGARCVDSACQSALTECTKNADCADGKRCLSGHCRSGCAKSADCEQGVCDAETEQCVECNVSEDCAKGQSCAQHACLTQTCDAGVYSCKRNQLFQCDELGLTAQRVRACELSEYCDSDAGDCLPDQCEASAKECAGDILKTCLADGSGFDSLDCSGSNQTCWDGACRDILCTAKYQCQGDSSYRCLDGGTRLELVEQCATDAESPSVCDADSGRCRTLTCKPHEKLCDNGVATVCNDDGSGPVPGGIDCAAANQPCWLGDCRDRVCDTPFVCNLGDAYRCVHEGSAIELVEACVLGTSCDAQSGSCVPDPCDPDQPICIGDRATTCAPDGSGPVDGGLHCADDQLVCVAGHCVDLACHYDGTEPISDNRFACYLGNVHHCDRNSSAAALSDTCGDSEYCKDGASQCLTDICEPGKPICRGEHVSDCASDGSGPAADTEDCSKNGEICELGACVALACHPSQRFCKDGNVALCNANGTLAVAYQTCDPDHPCDPGPPAHCAQ